MEEQFKSVFLQSNNLYLRPMSREDIPFLYRWMNDKPTRIKIGETHPFSLNAAEKYIDKSSDDRVWFSIIRKEDDAIIGETGLLRMFPAWRTTDLSIIIPDENNQGKGYGTEAINLMLSYAFGNLNFNRVAIGVVGFNEYAIKFYEKVGFKKEGIQEEGYYCDFKYYDFIMMRILKREFIELNNVSSKIKPEQKIESFIADVLTGDAQKNAFEFIAYLKTNGMLFERGKGYWEDKLYWMIKYNNEYVCFILINGSEDKIEPWIIWSDDSNSNWFADLPMDEHNKEIVWKNVDICKNCGGCDKPGGSRKTVFGKEFNNVCRTAMKFINPNTETLKCVKKLMELRKNDILRNL